MSSSLSGKYDPKNCLTIGNFKKRYLAGDIAFARAVDTSVYYTFKTGEEGYVVKTNGQIKDWRTKGLAAGVVEQIDTERFIDQAFAHRKPKA